MTVSEVLRLFYHDDILQGHPHIVPCLVGPTGSGKSTIVSEMFRELGLRDVRILLSTMLPEEVVGLPRVIEVDGEWKTYWTIPDWFSEEPIGLFLDELDKANEMTVATVLTLLSERRIRDKYLHPKSIIVAAMQPVNTALWESSETFKALSARLCFLPMGGYWEHLSKKYGVNISFREQEVVAPLLEQPSPRQVDWYMQHLGYFVANNAHDIIGRGMFRPEIYAELQRMYRGMPEYMDYLVQVLNKSPQDVKNIDITEVITLLSKYIDKINARVLGEAYYRVLTELSIDEIDRMHELQATHLAELCKDSDLPVDYTISPPEEILEVMGEVKRRYEEFVKLQEKAAGNGKNSNSVRGRKKTRKSSSSPHENGN